MSFSGNPMIGIIVLSPTGKGGNYTPGATSGPNTPETDTSNNPFSGSPATSANTGDSVSLSTASQGLILADDNRDGVVDQAELANASYQLLNNPEATANETALGQLYATMALGGQNGQGLLPDINGDGGITANELKLLAHGDGQDGSISPDDFSYAFGKQFTPDGQSFQLSDLAALASGKQPAGSPAEASSTGRQNAVINQQPAVNRQPVADQSTTAPKTQPAAPVQSSAASQQPVSKPNTAATQDSTACNQPASKQDTAAKAVQVSAQEPATQLLNTLLMSFADLLKTLFAPAQQGANSKSQQSGQSSSKDKTTAFLSFFQSILQALGEYLAPQSSAKRA